MRRITGKPLAVFTKGLNTNDNPFQIDGLREARNVRLNDIGSVLKRTGMAKINTTAIDANYVTSIFQYIDDYGNKTIYCIDGTKIYTVGATPAELSDGLGITKTLSSNKRASMFTWKKGLYISNGEEPAFSLSSQTLYVKGVTYVADYNNHRIQYFDLNGNYLGQWGSYGTGNGQFNFPIRVAVDSVNSKIYVSDVYNYRIQYFDLNGNYLGQWGSYGTGNGQFDLPTGIAVDPTNSRVYIVDTDNYRIQYFDLNGNYLGQWGSEGSGNGQFVEAYYIAVDSVNSKVYVSDGGNHRVQYFNLTGTYGGQWGSVGTGDGEFSSVSGISVDTTNSKVYVGDDGLDRVQYFNLTGTYGGQWGSHGAGNGQFDRLTGLTVDPINSRVYTVDTDNTRIQYFNLTGTYGGQWGSAGNGNGQFNYPLDIHFGLTLTITNPFIFKDLGTPGSLVAADSTTPGNPDGTYKYKVTYVTATGLESSAGIESNEITVATNIINLTNIPCSPMVDDVTSRYLYRTKDSGTTYYYLAEIADNTTTIYDDDTADANLDDTSVAPTINNLVPTFKYLTQFKDVLWGAGDYTHPDYLYWTDSLDEDYWDMAYFLPIGENEGSNIPGITGLYVFGDYLYVFKENSIWYVIPSVTEDLISASHHLLTNEYGAISGFTIDRATIDGKQGLIFADKDKGICFLTGGVPRSLSSSVQSDWDALNKTYLANAVGKYYGEKNEYWLSLTQTGTTNSETWIFNTKHKCVMKPFTHTICSMAIVVDGGTNYLYTGNFAGQIYKQDSTDADATVAISSYLTTGWNNLGYPDNHKVFDEIVIDYIEKGTWNATVYWAVDGASFSATNSYDVSMAGTSGLRNKHVKKLPNVTGRSISIKIANANASEPFEICGIYCNGRIRKVFVP